MADEKLPEIKLDPAGLYREEVYTDRRAGTLRKLIPVDRRGDDDPNRPVVYEGNASLMTPAGALPLRFQIDAKNIDEALTMYPEVAQKALVETLEELKRLQREHESSIVVPGAGAPGMGPGGMGGGGMGGGGMPGGGMPGGGRLKI